MATHLRIKPDKKPAMTITRAALRATKLVYVARANKPYRYRWGRSRIVYIGTTKRGVYRIASSAAAKSTDLLGKWGIRHLDFHIVQSGKLQSVETWKELERALLLMFKETFGDVPYANTQGKNIRRHQVSKYFRDSTLRQIIHLYS